MCVCVCVHVMCTPCSHQVQEIFGPVLAVYVYPEEWESILRLVNGTSLYGLTARVFARNQDVVLESMDILRHSVTCCRQLLHQ